MCRKCQRDYPDPYWQQLEFEAAILRDKASRGEGGLVLWGDEVISPADEHHPDNISGDQENG